jgi:LysR family transcriptional activator for leuABCD operon
MNLRGIDLNLLTVFEAVYEERNQQRAAERLAMTQPAVSSAMARLRDAVREDLFVPGARGVTPTVAADRLYGGIRPALEAIRDGLGGGKTFDPKSSTRTFRMTSAYASLGSVGEALAWIAKLAPGVRLVVESTGDAEEELRRRLRIGEIDVVVDHERYDDPELVHELASRQELVVIARKGHPRVDGSLTRKQLSAERHVAHLEPTGSTRRALALQEGGGGLDWKVDVELDNILAVPTVVCQSDLVAITFRGIADFYAKRLGLQVLELPFKAATVPVYGIWHKSRERDAGHAWLRKGLRAIIARTLPA